MLPLCALSSTGDVYHVQERSGWGNSYLVLFPAAVLVTCFLGQSTKNLCFVSIFVVNQGRCRMVFSDFAPLDHILPRYLSTALLRRLNKRDVETMGHTSVCWVGMRDPSTSETPPPTPPANGHVNENAEAYLAAEGAGGGALATGQKAAGSLRVAAGLPSQELSHAKALHAAHSAREDSPRRTEPAPTPAPATAGATATTTQITREKTPQVVPRLKRHPTYRWPPMTVMTSPTYDPLETAHQAADRVVLAGLDVAPLSAMLQILGDDTGDARGDGGGGGAGSSAGSCQRKPGSGTLELDSRRGAVVVNAELAASSRVWAAGDVACFPSQAHGGRKVVVRSADHAHHSGLIAGYNMAASALDAVAEKREDSKGGAMRGNGGVTTYFHSPAFVGEAPLAGDETCERFVFEMMCIAWTANGACFFLWIR